MADRKKHGWVFWLTVALIALPLLYVASFGPACWIVSRSPSNVRAVVESTYQPLMRLWWHHGPCEDALARFASFGNATHMKWNFIQSRDGRIFMLIYDDQRMIIWGHETVPPALPVPFYEFHAQ